MQEGGPKKSSAIASVQYNPEKAERMQRCGTGREARTANTCEEVTEIGQCKATTAGSARRICLGPSRRSFRIMQCKSWAPMQTSLMRSPGAKDCACATCAKSNATNFRAIPGNFFAWEHLEQKLPQDVCPEHRSLAVHSLAIQQLEVWRIVQSSSGLVC